MAEVPFDLNAIPGLTPPPGEVSNLKDPYSLKRYMYATASICLSVSTIAIILRVFVKVRLLHRLQLEEYILVFSQFTFIAFVGLMITAVQLGQGTHQWNVSLAHLQKIVEYSNIIEILYAPIILGAKTAMVLQIRRIFVDTSKGILHWLHEFMLWFNVVVFIALTPTIIWTCVPREKLWNPFLPGHCISIDATLIISASVNLTSNLAMLALPIAVIMRLQLPLKSKLVLSAVFGTSLLGATASTFRLVYTILLTRTDDFTWAIMPVGLWACAEVTGVILASSIPMLPKFLSFVRQKTKTGSSGTGWGSRSRGYTGSRGPKGSRDHPLPGEVAAGQRGVYYEMGSQTDTQVCESGVLGGDDDEIPLRSITKTVEVETAVSPAVRGASPKTTNPYVF